MKIRTTAASILMIGTIIGGISLPTNAHEKPFKETTTSSLMVFPLPSSVSMGAINMINKNEYCGLKSSMIFDQTETYSAREIDNRLRKDYNPFNSWSASFLVDKPVGIYRFWNGVGLTGGNNYGERLQTVVVGHKANWSRLNNAISTNNSVRNDSPPNASFTSNAESTNWVEKGKSAWFAFKLQGPTLQPNASLSDINACYYELSLVDENNTEGVSIKVVKNYSSQQAAITNYSIFVKEISSGATTYFNAESAKLDDYILVEKEANGKVKVSIAGANYPYNPGNVTLTVGETKHKKLKFKSYVKIDNFSIGPEDVITSFPCKEPSYYPLANDLDGGYYHTMGSFLFFKYDGEYNSGNLNYKVENEAGADVTASTSLNIATREVGDNRFKLFAGSLPVGFYKLTVTNEKNEKYYLRLYHKY